MPGDMPPGGAGRSAAQGPPEAAPPGPESGQLPDAGPAGANADGPPEAGSAGEGAGLPEAEAPGEEAERLPEAEARRRLEWEFLLAVRRAGSVMQILGAAAAERLGINTTDLNCLNMVALTGPMTAGDLARNTGLTTASITGVLDRLEESGFVRRERDTHDRRRVLVHLNFAGTRHVGSVFAPLIKAWRAALSRYTDDELRLILEFQGQVEQIMRDQVTRLRETPAAKPGTTDRGDQAR